MSAVPAPVLVALQAVQDDADVVGTCITADTAADAAVTLAAQQKAVSAAALGAARQHLTTDLAALVALEQTTYSGL